MCKKFSELQKIEELLEGIVIIIKKLSVNHGFVFPETLEGSKKDANNQRAMQQYLTKSDMLYGGIKLSNQVLL